jgi:hypothetical protein
MHTHKSLAAINVAPISLSIMRSSGILSFSFSILGLYGLVYYLRFLMPRTALPYVSAVLTEAEHLLDHAESSCIIPRPNAYRSALTLYKPLAPPPTDGHLADCRLSQLFQSTPADSDGKPSCPWDIAATSACCSVRSNLQAVYALVTGRGNQGRDQGSLDSLLFYFENY